MNIPNDANLLISLLIDNGYKAYAVGGFVRDAIMQRDAGDIDICSNATPKELECVLEQNDIKYIETGIKHGTVTAIINKTPYEITTFRVDGEYNDNRHPEKVEYVRDLKSDLSRRDFTINAIAYNEQEGIVDEFDGISDIDNKLIRCVGNADKRLKEDALRIMRAIRFSSVLGFEIEEQTKQALFENKELLKNIASERIYVELIKLLLGDNVEKVLIEYRDIIAVVIPELKPCFDFQQRTKWHSYDVYTHIVKSVSFGNKIDYMRLALLLHDIGKPNCHTVDEKGVDHFKTHAVYGAQIASKVLKRLKVSNEVYNKVTTLVANHNDYIRLNDVSIKSWLRNLGEDLCLDYIDLKIADLNAHNLEYSAEEIDVLIEIKNRAIEIIKNNEPYKISHLEINGNDLIKLGYSGKEIATELEALIETVSSNKDLNNKNYLIEKAKEDK